MSPSLGSSKEAMISAALKVYWEEFNKTSCACKEEVRCGGYAPQAEKFWNELNKEACPPQCPPPQGNNLCSNGGGGGGGGVQGCLLMNTQAPSTHPSARNVDMGGGPSLVLMCEGNLQSGMCAYKTVQSLSKCAAPPPQGGREEPPVEEVWSQQQATSCSGMRASCRQISAQASLANASCSGIGVGGACGPLANQSLANASCSGIGVGGACGPLANQSLANASCSGIGVGGVSGPLANQSAAACGSVRPSCVGVGGANQSAAACGSVRPSCVGGANQSGMLSGQASELFAEGKPSGAVVGGVAKDGGKGKYADFGSWLGSPCDKCGPCGKQ